MNLIAHTTREVLTDYGMVTELRANKARAPRLDLIETVNGVEFATLRKVSEHIVVG